MSKRKNWELLKSEIIAIYESGKSSSDIAITFDTTNVTICAKLRGWGVQIRRRGRAAK